MLLYGPYMPPLTRVMIREGRREFIFDYFRQFMQHFAATIHVSQAYPPRTGN